MGLQLFGRIMEALYPTDPADPDQKVKDEEDEEFMRAYQYTVESVE